MSTKKHIFSFLISFSVFCIGALVLLSFFISSKKDGKLLETIFRKEPPYVIYVHGWAPDPSITQVKEVEILKSVFPDSQIEVVAWAAQTDFNECLQRADKEAIQLAERIAALPEKKRRNLVLVGHSLGGRIAIRTMSRLSQKNLPIRSGIFLAAAIPHDDPDIAFAIKNSLEPNVNIYNRQDYILRHAYGVLGEDFKNALGAYGYAYGFQHKHLLQFENISSDRPVTSADEYIARLENHGAVFYMNFLKAKMPEIQKTDKNSTVVDESTAKANIDKIQVLQDRPNPPVKIIDVGWETLDSINGWRLQKSNTLFNGLVYRIVDPYDYQKANGDANKMHESFNNITRQLVNQKNITIE